MSSVIGVDLGGTNLRAAQVLPGGQLAATRQVSVDHLGRQGEPPFGQLTDMIVDLAGEIGSDLAGIGLSVTGPIDPVTGWVDNPFTLPAAMQGDLLGAVRSRIDVPLAVENDANAAALGEALHGAGRGGAVVVCVTIGTGVGVGVYAHGRLYAGAGNTHPEAGHLVVDPAGPPCYCGASGCIESFVSATAILDAAVTSGVAGAGATAQDVYAMAHAGDRGAATIVQRAASALAAGVRTLVAVYAPDVIVLAGNALGDADSLVREVTNELERFPFGGRAVSVRTAKLGNWAGCVGAGVLVRSRIAEA